RCVLVYICFFQAEDGIRDGHVTGVQTCALPIWSRGARSLRAGPVLQIRQDLVDRRAELGEAHGHVLDRGDRLHGGRHRYARVERSEERRVGKEWRWGVGGEDVREEECTGREVE